ncbi:hypothetical protein FPV67DRAFT_1781145 [Lyophyllum atratum]|nr:hypothetical protein FPV67DRAFT_1781145 [Lyophyllum atratum]
METRDVGNASAFSSITVREAAYARIQEGIAASEAVTTSWKRRHNELSVIFRLPPEILATVFRCTIEPSELEYRLRWFRVSHVCSHWRRVALECPSLWSDIPFSCPRWAEEMLARSKMAPLTIKAMFGEYRTLRSSAAVREATFKTALSQLSRIRHLSLNQSNGDIRAFRELARSLDSSALLLETFDIHFTSISDENRLPQGLFSGDSPRLVRLGIAGCGLNWGAPIFANLVSLKVTNIPNASRPPVDQVISALSHMSRLEKLELDSDFASASGELISPAKTANLPRLVHLSVTSLLVSCVSLMEHITYPSGARVTVTCRLSDGSQHVPATSFSLVRQLADTLGRRIEGPIRYLSFDWQKIRAWTSSGSAPSIPHFETPQLDLTFMPHQRVPFVTEIATHALPPLSLQYVESLKIDDLFLSKTAWVDHFGSLSQLTYLEVGPDDSQFLRALSIGTSAALEPCDQAGDVQFKALKSLTISGWMLDDLTPFIPGSAAKTVSRSLADCLKARRERGTALSDLFLDGCRHVTEEDVEMLREIVPEVEWDGAENFTESESEEDGDFTDSEQEESDYYFPPGFFGF